MDDNYSMGATEIECRVDRCRSLCSSYLRMIVRALLRVIRRDLQMMGMVREMMGWKLMITIHFSRTLVFHVVITVVLIEMF